MPPLRVERLLPQWATARVAPTAFLGGDSERRVQEAAPYKGRIPPERAGEDTRPYGGCGSVLSFRRGRTLAGPREGHTPGWLLSAFGRFTFSPSPTVLKKLFRDWVGEDLGPPAGICTSRHLLGKTRRSCGTASTAILEQSGPSGPGGYANRHSDFARRKFPSIFQVCVPRNGGPGKAVLWI